MSNSTAQRAIIFANGEVPDLAALGRTVRAGDTLVAADGGMRHLAALGLLPVLLIGDLDSLPAGSELQLRAEGVEVQRYPVEKDATDLELALDWTIARGFHMIRIAGALGGRLDHALGNLYLLTDPRLVDHDVRLDDGTTEVVFIRGEMEIEGQPGDLLSLLPAAGDAHGVWTHNLAYPLDGETLLSHKTRGISNVFEKDRVRVGVAAGNLFAIHTRGSDPNQGLSTTNVEEE